MSATSLTVSFGQLVSNIFQIALDEDISDFFDEVLIQVNQLIPFDGGAWTTYFKDSTRSFSTHLLHGQISQNKQSYFISERLDKPAKECMPALNSNLVTLYSTKEDSEIAELIIHETNQSVHKLVFQRRGNHKQFDSTEIRLLESLAPLIWQAYGVCLDINPRTNHKYKKSFLAICTSEFELVKEQAGFSHEISKIIPKWNKITIPKEFKLQPIKTLKTYKDYVIETFPIGGWVRVELFYVDPLVNLLTPKQFDIAALVVRSHSNKSIAENLNLSIKTVERHLQDIYQKLNASNRTEAIWHLSQSNINWNRYLPSGKKTHN